VTLSDEQGYATIKVSPREIFVFDLLQHPPHTPEPVRMGASVSIATHVALVLALALGTRQAAVRDNELQESIVETAIRYLLPPDKQEAASEEAQAQYTDRMGTLPPRAVRYGAPVPEKTGTDAKKDTDASAPISLAEAASAQDAFTLTDVDTTAARDPESAAPAYPVFLKSRGIEGTAVVRFVVDTTGRADPTSFQLIETNHPLFGAAVRDALPGMKFRPASIGARKVRQLVEQPFIFRIVRPGTPPPATKP
jgi:periplasmic protein TonB